MHIRDALGVEPVFHLTWNFRVFDSFKLELSTTAAMKPSVAPGRITQGEASTDFRFFAQLALSEYSAIMVNRIKRHG